MSQHFLDLYQKALAGLQTGGKTLEASLQEIEEGKRQAIAGGQQALVSGGLSGTTMAAGVPIQAEKIAARQRLGARGQAERTYLTTLASFAAFSQRGIEAEKQREFEALESSRERNLRQWQTAQAARTAGGDADQAGRWEFPTRIGGTGRLWGGDADVSAPTTAQAEQYPALYDVGGDYGGVGTKPGTRLLDIMGGEIGAGYDDNQWGPEPKSLYVGYRAGFASPEEYARFIGPGKDPRQMIAKESPEMQQYLKAMGTGGGKTLQQPTYDPSQYGTFGGPTQTPGITGRY